MVTVTGGDSGSGHRCPAGVQQAEGTHGEEHGLAQKESGKGHQSARSEEHQAHEGWVSCHANTASTIELTNSIFPSGDVPQEGVYFCF